MPPEQLLSRGGGWSILGHLLGTGGFRATFGGMTEGGVGSGRGMARPGSSSPGHVTLLFRAGRGLLGGLGFWREERRGEERSEFLTWASRRDREGDRGQRKGPPSPVSHRGHPTCHGLVRPGEAEGARLRRTGHPATRQRWLSQGWLPAGAILEGLEMAPGGGLVPALAGSPKTGVSGHPPALATKLPRAGALLPRYLRGRVARHKGPSVPRSCCAAQQAGLANVTAGQLATGGSCPASLLEERVGEAGGGPAGGPVVGQRDDVGLLRAPPELSLCSRGSAPLWGREEGNYPFWKCLVPLFLRSTTPPPSRTPESPRTASTAAQTTLLLPAETPLALGQAPPHRGHPEGMGQHLQAPQRGANPLPGVSPRHMRWAEGAGTGHARGCRTYCHP